MCVCVCVHVPQYFPILRREKKKGEKIFLVVTAIDIHSCTHFKNKYEIHCLTNNILNRVTKRKLTDQKKQSSQII